MVDDSKLKVFISYARADKLYFNTLKKGIEVHSNGLERELEIWDDTQLPVGVDWHDFIKTKIKDCDCAILLLSGNFLSSEYIRKHELKSIINRNLEGDFFIFSILIDPCNFKKLSELNKFHFFACSGTEYGLPNIPDLVYADLIRISDSGQVLLNPNRERYHIKLVSEIEKASKNNPS